MLYKTFKVKGGETLEHNFPENVQARWIRFRTDQDVRATAYLEYR